MSFIIPQASRLKHPMDTIITNDQKIASIIQVLHSGDNVSATMVSTSAAMIASRTATHNTMLSVVGLFFVFICLYVLLVCYCFVILLVGLCNWFEGPLGPLQGVPPPIGKAKGEVIVIIPHFHKYKKNKKKLKKNSKIKFLLKSLLF